MYNNGNQIVQGPGYVVFRNEMIHESRVIPLDGRPHVNPTIKMIMGDSRGRWEGNDLVVETTNFTDKDAIGSNGAGYPGDPGYHSDQLKVIERFTRTSDKTMDYRITMIDEKTWVKPWTILIELEPERRLSDGRVRLPRRKLCDVRHPERRARGRKGEKVNGHETHPVLRGRRRSLRGVE